MSEWISVKDRLPSNDDEVLCFFERDGICVGFHESDKVHTYMDDDGSIKFMNSGWEDNFAWARYGDCTHWMPLPKPPEKE